MKERNDGRASHHRHDSHEEGRMSTQAQMSTNMKAAGMITVMNLMAAADSSAGCAGFTDTPTAS